MQRRNEIIRFLFSKRELVVDDLTRSSSPRNTSKNSTTKENIIALINVALVAVLLLSFSGILVSVLVYPNREVPEILKYSFVTILGYFGGAISTYLKKGK